MNLVYNRVLVYDTQGRPEFVSSNIPQYNIHPWHTHPLLKSHDVDGNYEFIDQLENKLGVKFPYQRKGGESKVIMDHLHPLRSQSFEVFLDHDVFRHNIFTLDEIKKLDLNINYIYPIVLYNNSLFDKYSTISLDPKVIEDSKKGKCKICFIQPTEGFFGQDNHNFIWFDNFSKKYGLDNTNLYMITTNLIAKSRKDILVASGSISENSYTILDYTYFGSNLWFHEPGQITDPKCVGNGREKLTEYINSSLNKIKKYHFLNFNRVPKLHRILLYGFLKGNDHFKNKFISSLGGLQTNNPDEYLNWVRQQIPDNYEWKNTIIGYYEGHDSREHHWYDEPDLENNKASNLNNQAHMDSFVNIVSESLTHETTVFFSEKIYKPIFVAQPFIMVGNPKSLEVLQSQGFKTFSKWWDESYDQELDYYKRMDKIFNVLKEIASWDMSKCYEFTQEMLPTLIHNFNILMKAETLQSLFNEIEPEYTIKNNPQQDYSPPTNEVTEKTIKRLYNNDGDITHKGLI